MRAATGGATSSATRGAARAPAYSQLIVFFARLFNGAFLIPEALPVHSILVVTSAAADVAWLVIHDGQVGTMAWFLLGAAPMMAATIFALIPAFTRAPITMHYCPTL